MKRTTNSGGGDGSDRVPWLGAPLVERTVLARTLVPRLPRGYELRTDYEDGKAPLPTVLHPPTGTVWVAIPGCMFRMGLSADEERAARKVEDPPPLNVEEMRPERAVHVKPFLIMASPVDRTGTTLMVAAKTVKCKLCSYRFLPRGQNLEMVKRLRAGMPFAVLVCTRCHRACGVHREELEGKKPPVPKLQDIFRCPVLRCYGWVNYITDLEPGNPFFGCGECGTRWTDKESLFRDIARMVKRYNHRKTVYQQASDGGWIAVGLDDEDPHTRKRFSRRRKPFNGLNGPARTPRTINSVNDHDHAQAPQSDIHPDKRLPLRVGARRRDVTGGWYLLIPHGSLAGPAPILGMW